MVITIPSTSYKSLKLKRDWRRRINGASATRNEKNLEILSLREQGSAAPRGVWRVTRTPKLRLNIASPIKFLAKFHDAYADLMIYLNKKIPNPNSSCGGFLTNVATGPQLSLVSSRHDPEVDSELALEICKKLAASRRIVY